MGGDVMDKEILKMWFSFKKEIMHGNRYFFNNDIVKILSEVEQIPMFPLGTKMKFYRARKGKHVDDEEKEMLNPPAHMTNAGRCNPHGISYLYLASNEETAIKEIRLKENDKVATIAKFEVDVSNIFSFLPFEQDCMKDYIKDDKVKTLIYIINAEMSQEFGETDNGLSYIPLQFISEYIKKRGFDGFTYGSVVGKGMNLVMFNNKKARMLERYKINIGK